MNVASAATTLLLFVGSSPTEAFVPQAQRSRAFGVQRLYAAEGPAFPNEVGLLEAANENGEASTLVEQPAVIASTPQQEQPVIADMAAGEPSIEVAISEPTVTDVVDMMSAEPSVVEVAATSTESTAQAAAASIETPQEEQSVIEVTASDNSQATTGMVDEPMLVSTEPEVVAKAEAVEEPSNLLVADATESIVPVESSSSLEAASVEVIAKQEELSTILSDTAMQDPGSIPFDADAAASTLGDVVSEVAKSDVVETVVAAITQGVM